MKVELHLIQNFVPSCLNRDDTNTPKDCEFGGYRRARISSQCLKRAIRWDGTFQDNLKGLLSSRSVRFPNDVAKSLKELGVDDASCQTIGKGLQDIAKSEDKEETKKKGAATEDSYELDVFKTPQMVFYTPAEVEACAKAIKKLLDQGITSPDVVKEIRNKKAKHFLQLPRPRSADIALFGRMITSDSFENVDAACQVAHAISTHKVTMDLDYFTAVDDLQPKEEAGAGMIGVTGFNSSCFYRYSMVDMRQLIENMGGDIEVALKTLESFLRASIAAIPTGKQNSMAAHNPPDVLLSVVRKNGAPVSLANAFVSPVRPASGKGLTELSAEAMDGYWGKLVNVYGQDGILVRPVCTVEQVELKHLGDQRVKSVDELIQKTVSCIATSGGPK